LAEYRGGKANFTACEGASTDASKLLVRVQQAEYSVHESKPGDEFFSRVGIESCVATWRLAHPTYYHHAAKPARNCRC